MKNKPFELLKPEYFEERGSNIDERWMTFIGMANRILNERGKRGYTRMMLGEKAKGLKNAYGPISPAEDSSDTHEIYYFTRLIEKEKEECNHLLFCHVMENSSGVTSFKDFTNSFCPICGDKLK